jgi:arylsulfatase A-like enzyme
MRLLLPIAVSLALSGGACSKPPPSAAPRSPHVILVSIDTLRADHVSAYGYPRETTPFLDELALDAALFEKAYAHVPFTLISHMSLLTSLFPDAHGVKRETALSETIPYLPEVLSRAGYRTVGFYGADWLGTEFGFGRGFDRYEFNQEGGRGAETVEEAKDVLEEAARDPERPLFLFLHFHDAHAGPLDEMGAPLYSWPPPDFTNHFLPYPEVDASRHLPGDIYHDRVELTEEEAANVVAQYDGGILFVDSLLGDLFATLEALDLYDDSLVIVTADHGESLGDHGSFDGHGFFWEIGLRVPLVVKLPARHPQREAWRGVRVEHRVQQVDIAPTILNVVGVPVPDSFLGRDLLEGGERDIVASRNDTAVLIRGDEKLRLVYRGSRRKSQVRLFDLAGDPGETNPLESVREERAFELAKELFRLRRTLSEMHRSLATESGKRVNLDPAVRGRLEALGYLEEEE